LLVAAIYISFTKPLVCRHVELWAEPTELVVMDMLILKSLKEERLTIPEGISICSALLI
jgi:hypothetical protein